MPLITSRDKQAQLRLRSCETSIAINRSQTVRTKTDVMIFVEEERRPITKYLGRLSDLLCEHL
jgi:hypothetical protein